MKKPVIILIHVGFWICYLFILTTMVGILLGEDATLSQVYRMAGHLIGFIIVPSVASFYSFYFLIFPKFLQQKKILLSVLFAITFSITAALLGHSVLYLLLDEGINTVCGMSFIPGILFISAIDLACGVIALVIQGFITWLDEIKLKETLQQKNHEMELALVKAQLDPHFLFNTLNNIDVLMLKDASKASAYLNKLSDIMRFMLFESKEEDVLLSKEIEYIEKYIELQKIRTSNSKYINYSVSGMSGRKTIAPMIFIPFIENAFKHTANKKWENAININIIVEDETISFICENKFDSSRDTQQENGGLGNNLIQKRLNLIYPKRHILDVVSQNDLYRVHLIIRNE